MLGLGTLRSFINDVFSIAPTTALAAHITQTMYSIHRPLLEKLKQIPSHARTEAEQQAMRFFEEKLAPLIRTHHSRVVNDELGMYPPRLCIYQIDPPSWKNAPRDDDPPRGEEYLAIVLTCLFLNLGIPANMIYARVTEDVEHPFWRVRVLVNFDDLVRFALRQ